MSSRLSLLFSDPIQFLLVLLYTLPGIVIGFAFHEFAHSFVAYKMGDPTSKNLGRLTLDPIKHIDPVGMLCLIFLGFGWAKPVPVNPKNYKNRRLGELLVSIAGVTMNFILGIVFSLIFVLLFKFNVKNEAIIQITMQAVFINFSLMLFNLLPVGPLDGVGILTAIFWRQSYKIESFMNQYGMIFMIILIIGGVAFLVPAIEFLSQFFIRLFALLLGVPT